MATLGNNHYFLFEKTQVNNVDTLDTVATKSILVCISDSSISSLHISTIGLAIRVSFFHYKNRYLLFPYYQLLLYG